MARTPNFAAQLRKIILVLEEIATTLESKAKLPAAKNGNASHSRSRRSKREVAQLKKLLKSERKAGVPVAELAARHGVSTAYIYMLR